MRGTARLLFVVMATATACSLSTSFQGLTDGDESSSGALDGSASPSGEASVDDASSSSSGGPSDDGGGTDDPSDASPDAPPADASSDASPVDAGIDAPSDAGSTGYAAVVLADGPEGYWRLSEASGTTFADSSGNGHTATLNGSAQYRRPGALAKDDDGALQINGGLRLGDVFDFPGTTSFTIEAWVKPRLTTSGLMPIWLKMGSPRPAPGTILYVDQSVGTVAFERWVSGSAVCVAKLDTTLPTTAFTHIVVTNDNGTVTLYIDGEERVQSGHGPGVADNAESARWGESFDGTLDELAIYAKALGAARVKAHFDAAK